MNPLPFEERYFKDTGNAISNYADYTARRYTQLCSDLITLGIEPQHRIIDFGCATGALLYEFKSRGYTNIIGTDVSYWAVNYGRQHYGLTTQELQYLNYSLLETGADWLLCLDVVEHIGNEELQHILGIIRCSHMVLRVPVSAEEGQPYVLPVSRNDKTHVQCHTKVWWHRTLAPYADRLCFIHKEAIHDSEGVLAAVFLWKEQSLS